MSGIMERAQGMKDYCTRLRQQIHQNPELSLKEHETTKLIRSELEKMGIEIQKLDVETGVVGIIRGKKPGERVTALRADIDALAMPDLCGKPYASKNAGVAHTCGHDGHTAILLGVAKTLKEMEGELSGVVKLIFQPGEEGLNGASLMVKAGALDNPRVEEIVCLHGWPYFEVGEVGAWPGQYMASADKFDIKIIGQSGHGARPYKATNPITAASLAITALQNIVSSEIATAQQAVVSVCFIHAGNTHNVIPDAVELGGTVRCLDPGVRDELETRIKRVVTGAAQTMGCKAEIRYDRGVPSLVNHAGVVEEILLAAKQALGEAKVRALDGPVMGSEDFSFYVEAIQKGVFFRLGVGLKGEPDGGPALHNSHFDFNDEAIPTGIATMVQYVRNRHS